MHLEFKYHSINLKESQSIIRTNLLRTKIHSLRISSEQDENSLFTTFLFYDKGPSFFCENRPLKSAFI